MSEENEFENYEDPEELDINEEEDEVKPETKLADWKKTPTVANLKQDFEDSKPDKDLHVSAVNLWLDNLNMTGTASPKKVEGRSSISPKLIRKQAEWRYASLSEPFLSTDDLFNTDPVTYEDVKSAIQNGLVLNNQFNTKIQKIKFIDDYIRTAVDEGTVITRVGWEYEEAKVEVDVQDFKYVISQDQETMAVMDDLNRMKQEDPITFDQTIPAELKQAYLLTMESGQPIKAIPVGSHKEMQIKVIKNQPTVTVCDYRNVSIDPTCLGDLTKASFLIYNFETSISELEKDGKYSNLDAINISTSSVLGDPDHASTDNSSFNFTDKPRKKFVAYEYWGYWDIDGTGIVKPIVATWVGDVMIRLEENPFPDQQIPFVIAQYLPVRRSLYGEPDGELLIDNQKIIGAVTRGMIDIMGRSANGQIGTRKDALDVTNRRKFDKGMDYEFNAQVDPRQAFHMHTYPEIPQSAQLMLQMQNADAESMSGVKAFSSGISGQALGSTATGIRSALDATSKRELGILRRLAEGVKQIGRKIVSMNAEFLEEEEVIRITNEEFVTVRRDDLAGNFDLRLTISTAEADEHKAQELSFMLQTLGPNQDPEITRIIQADIARLRKMPELARKIEKYKPEPDPIQQEMAQLQVELLKAQISNEQAKANENNANGQLDQAKVQTELAKARQLGSSADKADLDFVEQESGVQQERTLQKMDRQTQGNLALKAADGENKIREKALAYSLDKQEVKPGLATV